MKAQKETKWVCIQLACSWRPRAFEEAHHWNIQAKFYNEKFPQVYESDITWETLYYEDHGGTLKHKCGKRIVTLSLLSFSLIVFGPSLFYGLSLFFFLFLLLTWDNALEKWWSSHFYLFTTQWLQLDTRTKMTLYECLRRCTGICNEPRVTCMK